MNIMMVMMMVIDDEQSWQFLDVAAGLQRRVLKHL